MNVMYNLRHTRIFLKEGYQLDEMYMVFKSFFWFSQNFSMPTISIVFLSIIFCHTTNTVSSKNVLEKTNGSQTTLKEKTYESKKRLSL